MGSLSNMASAEGLTLTQGPSNAMTRKESADGWMLLFDGKSLVRTVFEGCRLAWRYYGLSGTTRNSTDWGQRRGKPGGRCGAVRGPRRRGNCGEGTRQGGRAT